MIGRIVRAPREALAIAGDVLRLVALLLIVLGLWVATPGDPANDAATVAPARHAGTTPPR